MRVWLRARKAITVNAAKSLRWRLEAAHNDVEHIAPNSKRHGERMKGYVRTSSVYVLNDLLDIEADRSPPSPFCIWRGADRLGYGNGPTSSWVPA